MNPYRHTTIAAAGATLLAAAPLAGVFRTFSWLFYAVGVVVVVLAAALATRGTRVPVWAQLAAMFGAVVLLLSWLFGGGTTLLGVLPTPGTLGRFAELLSRAGTDARELAAPVPDTDGLLFTVAASIGLVAIVVHLVAVGLRQPALAGLPMLAIYSVPVAVLVESVSWISFGFAAAGFLWLLVVDQIDRVRRWGRRFTGDGRDVDIWEGSPLAATGRRLGLAGIVAAVLIPVAVPGMTAGFLEQMITGAGFGGGPGGQDGQAIDPIASLQGNLNQPERQTMLRVFTDDQSPGYLRLAIADEINRREARPRHPAQSRVIGRGSLPLPPADGRDEVQREEHAARIRIEGLRQGYLPAYPNTVAVGMPRDDGRWYHDDNTSVIWSRSTTRPGMSYQLRYRTYDYTAEQLRAAEPISSDHLAAQLYTEVPENAMVRRLVERLVGDEGNQYDRVRAIHDHFSKENGFEYSTMVPGGTSGSAVVDFLRNKEGYCQQYAVTMTWMLRTAGIPARVAIGFTQGTRESTGFTISNWDAHAWVEVYFDGLGWVPFDPTPSSFVRNDVSLPWAPNPYAPPPPTATASAAPDSTASAAPGPTREQRDEGDGAAAGAGAGAADPPVRWPYWLFAGLLLAALLAAPSLRRELVRRTRLRRAALPGSVGAAYAAWEELLDTLVDLDIGYQDSDSPRGVARRLTTVRPPLIETTRGELDLLARAVERASYSRQPLHSDRLAGAVKAVAAELHGTTTGTGKLAALVFPASVVRQWRDRVSNAGQTALYIWERWRDATTGQLPRRRRAPTSS